MTSRTSWTPGNGAALTWTALFGSELGTSMINGDSVLSSVVVANGTALDMFMDVSIEAPISSSSIAAGANFTLWIMYLDEGGSVYGDNSLTTTPAAVTPGLFPCATMPIRVAASQTTLYGFAEGVIIRPRSFAVGLQNNCGFTFSGAATCKYQTYNLNLNN